MKKKKQKILLNRWLPLSVWMFVIFFFSAIPGLHVKEFGFYDFILRKAAHMLEFAILAILTSRLFSSYRLKHTFLFAFLFAVFYSLTDEWHQQFVPGREGVITDIFVDTIGITSGLIFWIFKPKKEKTRKRK